MSHCCLLMNHIILLNHEFSDDKSFGSIVADALMSTLGTDEESSSKVVHENPSQDLLQPLPALQLLPSLFRLTSECHHIQPPSSHSVCVPACPISSTAIHQTKFSRAKAFFRWTKYAFACANILFSEEELAKGNTVEK